MRDETTTGPPTGTPSTSLGPRTRRATAADAAELVRLRREMYASYGPVAADGEWEARAREHFTERLPDGRLVAVVLDADPAAGPGGTLLACGVAWVEQHLPGPAGPSGLRAHVASISVDPAARGTGLGRAVVAALMDWVTESGLRRVDLTATSMGLGLYEGFGFTRTGGTAMTWVHPDAPAQESWGTPAP